MKYRYSCQILMELEFTRQILETLLISNFINIRPVETSCSRRTGIKKLIVAFNSFADAHKSKSAVSVVNSTYRDNSVQSNSIKSS
jgi:hypothetical protein